MLQQNQSQSTQQLIQMEFLAFGWKLQSMHPMTRDIMPLSLALVMKSHQVNMHILGHLWKWVPLYGTFTLHTNMKLDLEDWFYITTLILFVFNVIVQAIKLCQP